MITEDQALQMDWRGLATHNAYRYAALAANAEEIEHTPGYDPQDPERRLRSRELRLTYEQSMLAWATLALLAHAEMPASGVRLR